MTKNSPIGSTAAGASSRRARNSAAYRAELARLQPFEEIAREVIRLRMDSGLTQEEFARRMGTTKSAISRLESGHHAPSVKTLSNIATAFQKTLSISFQSPKNPTQPDKRIVKQSARPQKLLVTPEIK